MTSPTTDIAPGKLFSPWEWLLAFRYLRAKRKSLGVGLISAIAFTAIALAIAVLIIVMSVMNGFRSELLSRILGFNGHAYVQGQAIFEQTYPPTVTRLRAVPGVVSVTPLVESQTIALGRVATGAMVRGMAPEDLKNQPMIVNNIKAGSLTDFGKGEYGGNVILMGNRLAEFLGVQAGESITLAAYGGAATPLGGSRVVQKDYVVGGIFSVGMAEYDQTYILMPLAQAQAFFGRGGDVDIIEVMVADPDHINRVVPLLRPAAGEGGVVSTWQDRNASYWEALQVERNMIRIIMMLIVAIAALNIISALVMLVKNKERDIAILRTIGASQGSIMRVFLISGAAIGVTAAPVGVVLGVLFCIYITPIQHFIEWVTGVLVFNPDVYFLTSMPAKLDWGEVWLVFAWTLSISILVTLYPSWRASRTDPVEALRYE